MGVFSAPFSRITRLLRRKLAGQIVKHLLVGASGVIVNWATFIFLRQYIGISTLSSTIFVQVILVAYCFPLQKYFTFRNNDLKVFGQFKKFIINTVGYTSADFLLAWLFIDYFGITPVIGKVLGLSLVTPLNFLMQRLWVFSNSVVEENPIQSSFCSKVAQKPNYT